MEKKEKIIISLFTLTMIGFLCKMSVLEIIKAEVVFCIVLFIILIFKNNMKKFINKQFSKNNIKYCFKHRWAIDGYPNGKFRCINCGKILKEDEPFNQINKTI